MTELRIDIDRLVLRDVPPEWIEGLGPEIERAVAAAASDGTATGVAGGARHPVLSDRAAFADHVGRSIWTSVRGGMP